MLVALLLFAAGCTKESNGVLAPYDSPARAISSLAIQDSVYTPAIRWVGGYVAALGVNVGSRASLDTTLIALAYAPANGVKFPFTFGTIPSGVQSLVSQYGGTAATTLAEDNVYTYWVIKDEAWSQISALKNRPIVVDTTLAVPFQDRNDTLFISQMDFEAVTKRLDLYINIKNVQVYGRIASDITVTQSESSNNPLVTFTITPGVLDSAVSAVGICSGDAYNVNARVWEVISADVRPDTTIYWKNDVITSPFKLGQVFPGTTAFVDYPAGGLKRNQEYYLWFANKYWDQTTRLRSTPNYGFATFTVW